ncbi:PREDICTED: uncharacterized protein LOC109584075 [Amphimedon queenslandica]|uniref:Uncharacterized protein n=1 Tax=Amphimedon queenslandica TaxID=400682 RepID=A0AAN0JDZ8_AMPQE|nr:PREDICTED: uncharacterized protein LOC109584075 [Amphimedon queenslandica]|eukprot:XP_019855219.1 PREDICTED: uncharacterized protein LOC109584075 [Amphimedon queenslandica]
MMLLPVNKDGEALLTDIKVAVCIDYRKLEAFAEILCKATATAGIGMAIKNEYRENFCSNDSLMTNSTVGTAEELKIHFPQSMIAEFKKMRLKFGKTFLSVKNIIKANPPALEDMKDTLIFSYSALKPQVAKCEDIRSILELISENCSLNDISMLEFFVNESEIDGLAKVFQEYNEALKKFSETKLSQYLKGEFSYASPLQCEKITIVIDVDENAEELMLKDVKRLSVDIFHKLSRNVRLNVIRDGNSFTVTCSFPLILSDHLIAAALNNIDILKENRVKKMIIGYYTVYEVNDASTPTTKQQCASLPTRPSSDLSKQLMLSLKVQLINSEEEVATLNEESKAMKEEATSLKETLEAKRKMLRANIVENDKFKELAAGLQEKLSHLTKENEELNEIKKILEEQLALFQSEKGDIEDKEEKKLKSFSQPIQHLKLRL